MKLTRYLLFVLFIPAVLPAQQSVKRYNILWASYNNTYHFNKRWSSLFDAQVRTVDWANKWLLYALRGGVFYNINDKLATGAGFTVFRTAQYEGNDYFFKNEWRSWEEASYNLNLSKKINFFQRLRMEQRFLQQTAGDKKISSYQYILRTRYRIEWTFPLIGNEIKLLIGNEVFINPGYTNTQLFFDQNRTFGGLAFRLNSSSILQAQYIKIYQWSNPISLLEDQNVIRFNFVQQFSRKVFKSNS